MGMFMFTIMVRNYRSNEVQNKSWNFKPPQLAEIILSLLLDKDHDDLHYIAPLDVGENTDSFKTPVDHMEYPFSLYEDKNGQKSKYHESGVLYDTENKEESDTDEEEDSEIKENVFRDKEKEDIASNNHPTNRSSIKGTKTRPLKLLPNQ